MAFNQMLSFLRDNVSCVKVAEKVFLDVLFGLLFLQ